MDDVAFTTSGGCPEEECYVILQKDSKKVGSKNFKEKYDNITRDNFTLIGITDGKKLNIIMYDLSGNGYIYFDDLRYHNTDPKVPCEGIYILPPSSQSS